MMASEPFEVAIPQSEISDLHDRLRRTRWSPEFANDDWIYGANGNYLRDLVDYWIGEYDWRAQERLINEFDNYRTVIDGIPLHFIHEKGKGPDPIPIVLTHGWPWTFWDWNALIRPLTDPAAFGGDPADAFDVIVPSLPGFAFSNPLSTTGVTPAVIASLWDRLLHEELGYDRYGAAGGDWGAAVTGLLGTDYGEHLVGIYLSTPPVFHVGGWEGLRNETYAPEEAGWLEKSFEKLPTITSHVAVHSSDPQTLAWALNDSPVGLAAWLLERRRSWSDCGGNLENSYSKDFLLTTVSLYWFTQSLGSSIRIYAEVFKSGSVGQQDVPPRIETPTGIGVYPEEVVLMPRKTVERAANLIYWAVHPHGGHFAPAEVPDTYVDDLRSCFRTFRVPQSVS